MDVLILVTVSTICGYQKFEEIEDYGKHNRDWLCSVFGILPKRSPSDSTIQRVMKGISHESLAEMAGRLATELLRSETRTVAVDGKSMNSTSCDKTGRHMHNLTAFDSGNLIPLCTRNCHEKSNEITMWHDLLDACGKYVKDTLFTGDAMGCQTAIVEKIRSKGGHYLLGVKDNQKTLAGNADITRRLKRPDDVSSMTDIGHGRITERTCSVYSDLSLFEKQSDWKDLSRLVMVESKTKCVKTREVTRDVRFYISDMHGSAGFFNDEVRRHWAIENSLHWNLDNAFRQDRCVRRSTSASRNLDSVQKMAFCILSVNKMPDKNGADAGLTRKMRLAQIDKSVLAGFFGLQG